MDDDVFTDVSLDNAENPDVRSSDDPWPLKSPGLQDSENPRDILTIAAFMPIPGNVADAACENPVEHSSERLPLEESSVNLIGQLSINVCQYSLKRNCLGDGADTPSLSEHYQETGDIHDADDKVALCKQSSLDELLFELYDKRSHVNRRYSSPSVDSSSTEYSLSEYQQSKLVYERPLFTSASLQSKDLNELRHIILDLSNQINQTNNQLVKYLRNRERLKAKESKHCDMITAILQAWSLKTKADAKLRFSLQPAPGDSGFCQWRDAVAALVRRPIGIPAHFRYKVWMVLASEYIHSLQLDWNKVLQFAFNDRCNPDDDALGAQIVKDLHRTGCNSFSGVENEEDRAILQRVLLGYARWNKVTGYCQGFNILAALILEVTNKREADALKIMMYLVDKVLPKEYFAHNLRALTVDMAVFRTYLGMKLPKLTAHLTKLQEDVKDPCAGGNLEPPLTNVFIMQWFLTMFATCLPVETVLRLWDCILIDGSEILIRAALAIWTKLAKRVIKAHTADDFYAIMESVCKQLSCGSIVAPEELIMNLYKMAPLPLPQLDMMREKFMYDIMPFNPANRNTFSNEVDGAEGAHCYEDTDSPVVMIFKTMDIALLRKQYSTLINRQKHVKVVMRGIPSAENAYPASPHQSTPVAMNHLFVGKQLSENKRLSVVSNALPMDEQLTALTPSITDEFPARIDTSAAVPKATNQRHRRGKGSAARGDLNSANPTSTEKLNLFGSKAGEKIREKEESKVLNYSASGTFNDATPDNSQRCQGVTGTPVRLYNPFPKPVTGLLSAEKAQIGIKLGLYKPKDALAFMSHAQRKLLVTQLYQKKVMSGNQNSPLW